MARNAILKSFYASSQWQKLRLALIAERGPICQQCGKTIANPYDLIAHHKIELTVENVHDASVSLNPDNVELICHDCHDREHHRFAHQGEHNAYLVYGPPLSGKSTYVRQSMRRGDLVIDMDLLYAAVSMRPVYDKPENILRNVLAVRDTLLDSIKTRYGKWNDAYIIGGYPEKYRREQTANETGAELIFCDVSKDECMRRLEVDEERRYHADDYAKFIDRWFERYSA